MLVAAITLIAGELLAWQVRELYHLAINPVVVAFGAVGVVALAMSIIYRGADIEE